MQCFNLLEFWVHGLEYTQTLGNGLPGPEKRSQGRTGGKNGVKNL